MCLLHDSLSLCQGCLYSHMTYRCTCEPYPLCFCDFDSPWFVHSRNLCGFLRTRTFLVAVVFMPISLLTYTLFSCFSCSMWYDLVDFSSICLTMALIWHYGMILVTLQFHASSSCRELSKRLCTWPISTGLCLIRLKLLFVFLTCASIRGLVSFPFPMHLLYLSLELLQVQIIMSLPLNAFLC